MSCMGIVVYLTGPQVTWKTNQQQLNSLHNKVNWCFIPHNRI